MKGDISFFDGVEHVSKECSAKPTPSRYDKICSNFMSATEYQFRDHTNPEKQAGRDGVEEIHLLQITEGIY